ncbi:hypothetical protein ElyMa_005567700 [Elysia marginata]|uniref:Uncharacterized protein n=1 Tax=Elysia marginata TaxID=1093978 RepID=A0AAV4F1A6_9GAST|nr:hypothetical protein ElyMa_005567700 [Elysia marginata]
MITEGVATLKRYKYGLKRQSKRFGRTKSCYEGTLVSIPRKEYWRATYSQSSTMVAKHGHIPRRFKRRYSCSKCGATGDFSKKTTKEIIQVADVDERLLQQLMKRKRTHHERQLGTFATTIAIGENRREEKSGKAKKELDGRCKGMVRVHKLWRYETEGREQRRMERYGCQPSDRRRHLIINL